MRHAPGRAWRAAGAAPGAGPAAPPAHLHLGSPGRSAGSCPPCCAAPALGRSAGRTHGRGAGSSGSGSGGRQRWQWRLGGSGSKDLTSLWRRPGAPANSSLLISPSRSARVPSLATSTCVGTGEDPVLTSSLISAVQELNNDRREALRANLGALHGLATSVFRCPQAPGIGAADQAFTEREPSLGGSRTSCNFAGAIALAECRLEDTGPRPLHSCCCW